MSGWTTKRVLLALCTATALVVLPRLSAAATHPVSEGRAPSIGAQRRLQAAVHDGRPVEPTDGFPCATPARAPIWRGQAARSGAKRREHRPGEAGRELYLYEGPNVAAVASGAGVASVERRFVYDGVDHPLWMWDRVADAGVYFELDCIGNVRRLRGGARYGAGAALPSDLGGYKYTAFGRSIAADAGTPAPVVDGVSFAQPLRWQGRWLDSATGIYDVRNRQWSPELGAFLSADEFAYFHTEATLWSWPGQNPVRYRDSTGRVGDETIILMHHSEPTPPGLPPGPASGVFVGLGGGASFTGAVSVGAGQFFGAATPDASYSSLGLGIGFFPSAGAGVQAGWFAGTAEEFGQSQTLFLGVGMGVGVEGALIFGPNGSFGVSVMPQVVWGSPVWAGTILESEGKAVCE